MRNHRIVGSEPVQVLPNRFGPVLETHRGVGQLRHPRVEAQSLRKPVGQRCVVDESAGTVNEQKSADHAVVLSSAMLSSEMTELRP
jgi:hypothetical protein